MTWHLRFHGRGGEGVKLASRIVSRAAFLEGRQVQDSPLYGAERRGAPVVAYTRISDRPIHERGYIDTPDAVIVMDSSLLVHVDADVLSGVSEATLILVNSGANSAALRTQLGVGRVEALDVSSRVLAALSQHLLSAPMASFTLKATGVASWETTAAALRRELGDIGVGGTSLDANLTAAAEIYQLAPLVGLTPAPPNHPAVSHRAYVPHMAVRLAAPSIERAANSSARETDGWRVFRPEIDLSHCTRCFLCFALCPEGAIHLDTSHYPHVDYVHCKGCLVCAHECPPHAIHEVREAAV